MSHKSKLFVVKIGSGLLANKEGGIDTTFIAEIVRQIAALRKLNHQVVLVSSGAISSGMTALDLKKRPKDIPSIQACATIGQPLLMQAYTKILTRYKMCSAQILMTSWDLDSRKLYYNAQSTLKKLLEIKNCVPIFNENDALSFEEIKMVNTFGDNDRLSSHISVLAEADKLVILSGIDGLNTSPDGSGNLVTRVRCIDATVEGYAGTTNSERSVGGMISKLEAAKTMFEANIPMVIANGHEKNVLVKLAQGKQIGTLFQA